MIFDCYLLGSATDYTSTRNVPLNKNKTIALIEIGGSHDECLLTQMHAIRESGHSLLLITSQEVLDRNPIFQNYVDSSVCLDIHQPRKTLVRQVWKALKSADPHKVVLNTAQGKVIRDLCFRAFFHPIEFIGIIHTTRMFTESFTQKLIHRKVKKYLLLSEYLFKKVTPLRGIDVDYFYPLRFPVGERKGSNKEKTVVIIGGVEERRKDLAGCIQMVKSLNDPAIRFVFLGKSDPSKSEVQVFLANVESEGLQQQVVTFDHFVSQEMFDAELQHADLILPLVHPETPSADQYFRNQISGAMTVSFGYKIPLLLHEAYEHIEEMQPASFYYNLENFPQVLSKALSEAADKRLQMQKNPVYTVEEQERRYARFLGIE